MAASLEPRVETGVLSPLESVTSSVECDLMIDSLQRELKLIRSQLEAIVLNRMPSSKGEERSSFTEESTCDSPRHSLSPFSLRDIKKDNKNKIAPRINCKNTIKKPAVQDSSNALVTCTNADDSGLIRMNSSKGLSVQSRESVITKQDSLSSWNKQLYYINLVTDKERERDKIREEYLTLMKEHISNQLVQLKKEGHRLSKKMERRLAREKASKQQASKPFRSKLKIHNETPSHYQSTYYKAIVDDYNAEKSKKSLVKSSKKDSRDMYRGIYKRGHRIYELEEFDEEDEEQKEEEEDDFNDEEKVNSWAVTADIHKGKRRIAKKEIDTVIRPPFMNHYYPKLIPLVEILGESDTATEETQKKNHTVRMNKLTSNHRKLMHMYELSRRHQIAGLKYKNHLDEDEVEEKYVHKPVLGELCDTLSHTTLDNDRSSPSHTLPSLSTPSPSLRHTPISQLVVPLPPISPAPLLSLDDAIKSAPIVKEPRQLSSLWRNYNKIIDTK